VLNLWIITGLDEGEGDEEELKELAHVTNVTNAINGSTASQELVVTDTIANKMREASGVKRYTILDIFRNRMIRNVSLIIWFTW